MEGGNAIVLKAVKEICDRLDSLVGNTYLLSLLLTRGETGRVEYYLIEVNSGKELTEMDVDVKDLKDFKRFVEEKQAGHLVEGIRMSKIDVRIMREIFESICQSKMVMEVEPATINCWLQDCFMINLRIPLQISQITQNIQVLHLGYRYNTQGRLSMSGDKEQRFTKEHCDQLLTKVMLSLRAMNLSQKQMRRLNTSLTILHQEIELILAVTKLQRNIIEDSVIKPNHRCCRTIFADRKQSLDSISKQLLLTANDMVNNINQLKNRNSLDSLPTVSWKPQKLSNPHQFLRVVTKDKHKVYYTKGVYEYYHYGDQSFNDQGWGCAYRALQTLLSWFDLQDYICLGKMPTIPEFQVLIDSIDYARKLKNTQEWIGAIEVSWTIKKITGYDCRIINVSTGQDILQHCEFFRAHFQTGGSPIMYGGGQYAYSIVGLNYSWKLGECEFLILDPHYNGGDNIDRVLQKKGVSWRKPAQMFLKGTFYNFCLPIILSL